MKIVIHRTRVKLFHRGKADYQFYFVIVSSNGRTVATSETYTRKWSAMKTAKRFKLRIEINTLNNVN
jgi:uncharacterized protein YegP (UPF0339 family)